MKTNYPKLFKKLLAKNKLALDIAIQYNVIIKVYDALEDNPNHAEPRDSRLYDIAENLICFLTHEFYRANPQLPIPLETDDNAYEVNEAFEIYLQKHMPTNWAKTNTMFK